MDAIFQVMEINWAKIVLKDARVIKWVVTGLLSTYWTNWVSREDCVARLPEESASDLARFPFFYPGGALIGLNVGDQIPLLCPGYAKVFRIESVNPSSQTSCRYFPPVFVDPRMERMKC